MTYIAQTKELVLLIFACLYTVRLSNAIAIDNHIDGIPRVFCFQNGLRIQFKTEKPFTGHLYVKGMYGNPQCNKNFTGETDSPTLAVSYDECINQRERMANPPGMAYMVEFIAQFHQFFTTKVDRAFIVTCMYREAINTVTQNQILQGNVNGGDDSIPVTRVSYAPQMPTCYYTIHRGSPTGPLVSYARIGEKLYHVWDCPSSADGDFNGILIHSCQARDGRGGRVPLLDKRGCTLDQFSMPTPTYSMNLTTAYVEIHAFKFADDLQISFSCAITMCLLMNRGCVGITPPTCEGTPGTGTTTLSSDGATGGFPGGNSIPGGYGFPPPLGAQITGASPVPSQPGGQSYGLQPGITFPQGVSGPAYQPLTLNPGTPSGGPPSVSVPYATPVAGQAYTASSNAFQTVLTLPPVPTPSPGLASPTSQGQSLGYGAPAPQPNSNNFQPYSAPPTQRLRRPINIDPKSFADLFATPSQRVTDPSPINIIELGRLTTQKLPSLERDLGLPVSQFNPDTERESGWGFINIQTLIEPNTIPPVPLLNSHPDYDAADIKLRDDPYPKFDKSDNEYDLGIVAQNFVVFDKNAPLSLPFEMENNGTDVEQYRVAKGNICLTVLAFSQMIVALTVLFVSLIVVAIFLQRRSSKRSSFSH